MLHYLKLNFLVVSTSNSVMRRVFVKPTERQGIALPSAQGRPFAAVVLQLQRPIISWLCARPLKETLPSHIFFTIWCSMCATQARGNLLCHNMFYDHNLAEIRMLPEVHIITD